MSIGDEVVASLARKLLEAEFNAKPIEPITSQYPGITVADARRINLAILNERLARGERVIGFKVAFTSRAAQQAMGIDRPEWGFLTSGMAVPDGGEIQYNRLIAPRVEAEIAFLFKEEVKGPGVTPADVLKATEGVIPAIEVVDSRVSGRRRIEDFIADSSGAARVVLGGSIVDARGLDLKLVGCIVEVSGEVIATAAGAAALGNPVNSVVFLANALADTGWYIKAGHIVITGSLITPTPVKQGDYVRVTFDRLGSVSARFT